MARLNTQYIQIPSYTLESSFNPRTISSQLNQDNEVVRDQIKPGIVQVKTRIAQNMLKTNSDNSDTVIKLRSFAGWSKDF